MELRTCPTPPPPHHTNPNFNPAPSPTSRLEAAYEAAVVELGGLHAARPKQLLEILQPEFPDLALQVG